MNLVVRLLPRALAATLFFLTARATFAAEPAGATAPNEADCAAFGRRLADLLDNGKTAAVMLQLDKTALMARITPGLGFTEKEERDFSAGMLNSLPVSMEKQFAEFTAAHFLRVQTVGPDRRVLLRLVSNEGGASYMAFVCARTGTGPVAWIDTFNYTTGETISQSARRTALPLVAHSKRSALAKLVGTESAFLAHLTTISQANRLFQSGKFIEAWTLCEGLPPAVQKDRSVLILRLRLAQAIDDVKYLRVIGDWEAAFPGDATLDFISIDGDILRKDYKGAIKHIDSFAQRIGGDAYLDALAANIYSLDERYDDARQRARAALAVEPTLTDAYDSLLSVSLKTKNFAETVTLLDELHAAFPAIDLDSVAASEDYAEFRLSRAYRDWSAKRKTPAGKSGK